MSQNLPWLNGLPFFPFHALLSGTRGFGSRLVQFVRSHEELVPDAHSVIAALEEANAFSARLHAHAWVWREIGEVLESSVLPQEHRMRRSADGEQALLTMPEAAHLSAMAEAFSGYPARLIELCDSVDTATVLRWRRAASTAVHHLETAGLITT